MKIILLLLLVASFSQQSLSRRVCKRHVEHMKYLLRGCIYDRRIAHTVRLVFHDCVGPSCDGCFNFDHPFNSGAWTETIRLLNQFYVDQRFDRYVSYADYYVLAGIVAIEEGVKNANRDLDYGERVELPRLKFRYGRKDCPTAPDGTVFQPLPDGNLEHAGIKNFFRTQFDFDHEESVAIMGGHTLGGATGLPGSGWLGFWKENAIEANKFDNRYYGFLVDEDLTWNHLDKAPETQFFVPRWQWEGINPDNIQDSFMLNADVALFLKIQLDADGMSSCNFDTCSRSSWGQKTIQAYADSYADWLDDFEDVWEKMTQHGAVRRLKNPRSC